MQNLPSEILVIIFNNLSVKEVYLNVTLVCKKFYEIIKYNNHKNITKYIEPILRHDGILSEKICMDYRLNKDEMLNALMVVCETDNTKCLELLLKKHDRIITEDIEKIFKIACDFSNHLCVFLLKSHFRFEPKYLLERINENDYDSDEINLMGIL